MCGIEEREDEVLMLKIDKYNKYEAYDGMECAMLLCLNGVLTAM